MKRIKDYSMMNRPTTLQGQGDEELLYDTFERNLLREPEKNDNP